MKLIENCKYVSNGKNIHNILMHNARLYVYNMHFNVKFINLIIVKSLHISSLVPAVCDRFVAQKRQNQSAEK